MKKKRLRPVVAFAISALILSGIYVEFAWNIMAQKREQAAATASSEVSAIRDRMDVIFARDYTLSSLIVSDYGSTEGFDVVAGLIFDETASSSGISLKNIAVAPDGVVEKVYPLLGNEGLLGFDFMDTGKEGNAEAIEAYHKGKLVVTNPFPLVQGGIGMGGRLPVFIEENGQKKFWGLVTITLDYEELMRDLQLENLRETGYYYRLWYLGDDGQQVELASSMKNLNKPVTKTFEISNLSWNLEMAPVDGWFNVIESVAAVLIILGLSLLLARIQSDKMKIEAANAKLERLAHLDALTSCYSRQYVNTVLVNQETGMWNDPMSRYSLAMIDVDHFKSVNDQFGHECGDQVLVEVAQVLRRSCKAENGDCVIRQGGDEFIVLYNNVTEKRFREKLEEIVTKIRKIRIPSQQEIRVAVSIGAEWCRATTQEQYYDQMQLADARLYQAKDRGRNCYCMEECVEGKE